MKLGSVNQTSLQRWCIFWGGSRCLKDSFGNGYIPQVWLYKILTPSEKLTWLEYSPFSKMYFLLNLGYCSALLVYFTRGCIFLRRCLKDIYKDGRKNYLIFSTSCSKSWRWIIRSFEVLTAGCCYWLAVELDKQKNKIFAKRRPSQVNKCSVRRSIPKIQLLELEPKEDIL